MSWLRRQEKLLCIIVFMCIVLFTLPRLGTLSLEYIVNFAPTSIALAALVFIALYALKAVVIIVPLVMLYIAAGIVFPPGWALLVTYLGLTASLSVGYAVGKILGEQRVRKTIARHKKLEKFLFGWNDNLSSLCFISRLLPFPFDFISMFFGALGMPFLKYLFVSLLGKSPFMIPCVLAGAFVSQPLSIEFLVPFGLSLMVVLGVFVLYKIRYAKREQPEQS